MHATRDLPLLVLETDVHADVDDVGALALALALARAGHANLAAIGVNTPSRWGVGAVRAVTDYYGVDVPIGRHPDVTDEVWKHDYARVLTERFVGEAPDAPLAVSVLRKALASAPDGSVTVVSIGFFRNLVDLVASGPDEFSPLGGAQLVGQKVGRTVVMGGMFPRGREFNLVEHTADTSDFLETWPGRLEFVGFETADRMITGRMLAEHLGEDSPVTVAYDAYNGRGSGRPSWDLLAVYTAVFPDSEVLNWSATGELVLEPDGTNVWHPREDGPHSHASLTVDQAVFAGELDGWLAQLGVARIDTQ